MRSVHEVPYPSRYDSWARLQPPRDHELGKQLRKWKDGWMDAYCLLG